MLTNNDNDVVFCVCKDMLLQRNYTLTRVSKEDLQIEAITSEGKKVQLQILQSPKLNIQELKNHYTYLLSQKITHSIIIYRNTITSSVKKIIGHMEIEMELFNYNEMKFNITQHRLVPLHRKINNTFGDISKYPILKKTDPISRFYYFRPGDLIQITRNNGSISFRVVH